MTNRYLVGNAQTIGRREIQNNIFSTAYNDAGDLLAVLADGTIDHPNGRIAAIIAVGCCINTFIQKFPHVESAHAARFMMETALKANRKVVDAVYLGKSPRLSLTMAMFRDNGMHFFSVGVNRIFLYDGHNERAIGADANNPYSDGMCDLSPGSIVGILSVGAYSHAHPMERIKIVESRKSVFDKAQDIIGSVDKKGLTNQLSATALLIEVTK